MQSALSVGEEILKNNKVEKSKIVYMNVSRQAPYYIKIFWQEKMGKDISVPSLSQNNNN